jgi:hypothetical protein
MARARSKSKGSIRLQGFFRVQKVCAKTGKILGDSGYVPNQITNYGLESCIVARPISGIGNTTVAKALILGEGTVPASSATNLNGSNSSQFAAFGGVSIVASLTARMTASFAGSNGSMSKVANIGVLDAAIATDGKLIAGNTFASSAFGTDQNLNATYEFRYTTS